MHRNEINLCCHFDICTLFALQLTITSLHPDDHRKAEKLKKKKRRKEKEHQTGEENRLQQSDLEEPEVQSPLSLGIRMIKEEPEDELSIPLHPQCLPSPSPCKEEPKEEPREERRHWDGRDLEEGVIKVQKVEGFSGSRTVFRQGKQVVFRDEDGSGEDEDIMVDSGKLFLRHNMLKTNRLIFKTTPDCNLSPQMTTRGTW